MQKGSSWREKPGKIIDFSDSKIGHSGVQKIGRVVEIMLKNSHVITILISVN
jgi:hypothetical protein